MKSRIRSAVVGAVPLSAIVLLAACAAPVQTDEGASTTSSAALTSATCDFNFRGSWTYEGDAPTRVWTCETPIAPYTAADPTVYCTGESVPVPGALAGKGCTRGTVICLSPSSATMFLCPSSVVVPSNLGVYGSPTCPTDADGRPGPIADSFCSASFSFTKVTESCVGDAPPGWKYVVEESIFGGHGGIGCGGGCTKLGTGWPLP